MGVRGWRPGRVFLGWGSGRGSSALATAQQQGGSVLDAGWERGGRFLRIETLHVGGPGGRGGALMGDGGVLQAECMRGSEDSV